MSSILESDLGGVILLEGNSSSVVSSLLINMLLLSRVLNKFKHSLHLKCLLHLENKVNSSWLSPAHFECINLWQPGHLMVFLALLDSLHFEQCLSVADLVLVGITEVDL